MTQVIPRPPHPTIVNCPGCGHPIDAHDPKVEVENSFQALATRGCLMKDGCHWTPNDIAYQLVYGGLTRG